MFGLGGFFMTYQDIWLILAVVLGTQVIIWSLYFYWAGQAVEKIKTQCSQQGEHILIGPGKATYQGWTRRFGIAQTMGRIVLTEKRLLFKRPLQADIDIPLDEVLSVSDTAQCLKIKHTSSSYLSLVLKDKTEIVFMVHNQKEWISNIQSRIKTT